MAARSSTLLASTGRSLRGSLSRTPLAQRTSALSVRRRSTLPPGRERPPEPIGLSTSPAPSGRLARAYPALVRLSARTGVPLPSLGISFLVLHELTALLPVVLLFWLFQWLGLGLALVAWIKGVGEGEGEGEGAAGVRALVRGWYGEAEGKVERVGKRYGILGYDKVVKGSERGADSSPDGAIAPVGNGGKGGEGREGGEGERERTDTKVAVGEAVADAIASYVVVKALLPVRLAASVGLAPAFARFALNPIQRLYGRFRARR